MSHPITLENAPLELWREFFAEEIRMVAALERGPLVEALAVVPREAFLGAAPWKFGSAAPSRDGAYRTTWDVCDLYHDVFVAIHGERRLNNGQPSLIVRAIADLRLKQADRVLHLGCGTGYYTALMAEVVGADGVLTAVEIDAELARAATSNLSAYKHVSVACCDGATWPPPEGAFDGIFVNAAVTRPAGAWLSALAEGGRMVLPLSIGETMEATKALLVVVKRVNQRYAAELCSIFHIFQSISLRSESEQRKLRACVESKAIGRLRSLRVDDHKEDNNCLVHGEGFCWNAEAI